MLIIERREGESVDITLKRYKNKHRRVKMRDELRRRKQFTKPSVERRNEFIDAIYKQKKRIAVD